jgi:hypothetical protein
MSNQNIPDKELVMRLVKARILESALASKKAMDEAQASANTESKSSMGDKYETGRAMAQLDRDIYARRYDQIMQDLDLLNRIGENPPTSQHAKLGSMVETTVGWVLLTVSLGVLESEGVRILVVSAQSPLGKLILGKSRGDSFTFQGKVQRITAIY